MPSSFTPHYNLELIGYDEQDETWGNTTNTNWSAVDTALYNIAQAANTAAAQSAPSGLLGHFSRASAPAGWIKAAAGTIGSAASGATIRGAADTQALFILWWNEFPSLVLQNSSGVNTTRGANAAADFAANKRLPVFDMRDRFTRGWIDGGGGQSAALGVPQSYAQQNITGNIGNLVPTTSNGSTWIATGPFQVINTSYSSYAGAGAATRSVSFDASRQIATAPEVRPVNTAWLACWKL